MKSQMKKSREDLRSLYADLSTIHKLTEAALTKCDKMFDSFYNHIEMGNTGDYKMNVTTSEKSEVNTATNTSKNEANKNRENSQHTYSLNFVKLNLHLSTIIINIHLSSINVRPQKSRFFPKSNFPSLLLRNQTFRI